MRRGGITSITESDIDIRSRLIHLDETKTNISRVVPLSRSAVKILQEAIDQNPMRPFSICPDYVSQSFRRCCTKLDIDDLRFHDTRHEAISRLFEKGLSVVQVATISGRRDYRMLARYTHLSLLTLTGTLYYTLAQPKNTMIGNMT
jgi:integrase